MADKIYDVVIVGAGTAGLSAAIYALRAGKSVLVLEAPKLPLQGILRWRAIITPPPKTLWCGNFMLGTALKKRPRMPMATPPGAWTLPLTIPAAPI